MRKGNISFIFVVFLRTIFQEGFSELGNFSDFTPVPPVVTARQFVTRTALWEVGLACRFCVDRFMGLTVCDFWTVLCVGVLFPRKA